MKFNSLKTKLFIWYILSLLLLTILFYVGVHTYQIAHSDHAFQITFVILGITGFFLIQHITNSITTLSDKMKKISTRNLDERIGNISGDDEIAEVSRSFNSLLDRIQDGFKREKQFIGDVAHEFKTPLTTIRSDFEITLSKERSVEEYKQALQDGIVEIDKVSTTLNKVLELARSNILMHEPPTKFCISDLCAELLEALSTFAESKGVTLNDDLEHMLYIIGYKDRMATAFINIIENAITYTPSGGIVTVSVKT